MGLDERMHILAAHNAALLRHKMFEPMDDVRIDRANGLCCIGIAQRPFTLWNANGQDSHVFAGIALSFRARPLGRLGLWGGAARALFGLGWRYRDIRSQVGVLIDGSLRHSPRYWRVTRLNVQFP
jgi:hypothetical protein